MFSNLNISIKYLLKKDNKILSGRRKKFFAYAFIFLNKKISPTVEQEK